MVGPPDQQAIVGAAGVERLHHNIDDLVADNHKNRETGYFDVALQAEQKIESIYQIKIQIWISIP